MVSPAPTAADRTSLVPIPDAWYVACASRDLGAGPLARTVLGVPLVLFRGEHGDAAALEDRCPHRNLPLSLGWTEGGTLACGYHGWRFAPDGTCTRVPGLPERAGCRPARSYATREQHGFVWVFMDPARPAAREPFAVSVEPGDYVVRREVVFEASLCLVLENFTDQTHQAALHRGLFRQAGQRREVRARVRCTPAGLGVDFVDQPKPDGWVARLVAPLVGGGVEHTLRVWRPGITESAFVAGDRRLVLTGLFTPEDVDRTRMYAVARYRGPVPGWLLEPLVRRLVARILRQDALALEAQTRNIRRFGGEWFDSTELDTVGNQIWRLLRLWSRGEGHDDLDRVLFDRETTQWM